MNTAIINKLKELKPILKERYGIEEFALFGSYARDEQNEQSDIDIAIVKIEKKDYFKRVQAKYYLEEIFKKSVDIGYLNSMRSFLKKRVEKEMIYV
jgi:uncharacterized protein